MTMNALPKLTGHWQMHRPALESLIHRVNATDFSSLRAEPAKPGEKPYEVENGVARVSLVGVMTDYPTILDSWCQFAPASVVMDALARACRDPLVTSIEMFIDSPGGLAVAGGMLAQAVAACTKDVTVKCGGIVASAAYRAASQADVIIANRDSQVGSIGTYTVLSDTTKLQDEIGIRLILVSSGGLKGAGADGNITPEFQDDMQREVIELNDLFVADVATGRGLKQDRARELADGRVHIASRARSLGLVDEVETVTKENRNMNAQQFTAFADANAEAPEVKNLIAKGHKLGKAEGLNDGVQQERQRVLALFTAFPGRHDFVKAQVEKGADAQAAKADFADVVLAENETLKTQLAAKPTPTPSPAPAPAPVGQGAIPIAPPAPDSPKPDGSDPKAVAEHEWDTLKPTGFSSKERYVAVRVAELSGKFRSTGPATRAG
jgi:signal peptide peptidase SppA